jgi:hypothetical protein
MEFYLVYIESGCYDDKSTDIKYVGLDYQKAIILSEKALFEGSSYFKGDYEQVFLEIWEEENLISSYMKQPKGKWERNFGKIQQTLEGRE